MAYELPDMETLAKYMYLLHRVLIVARATDDARVGMLMDAVENVPDLLMRWPDMQESWVRADLERFEERFPQLKGTFTRILDEGAPANWQLKMGSSR